MRIISDNMLVPNYYETIQLSKDWKLIFTRQGLHLPLYNFRLTESMPCISPNEYETTPGRPIIMQQTGAEGLAKQGGCVSTIDNTISYDFRYRYLDKVDEATLF